MMQRSVGVWTFFLMIFIFGSTTVQAAKEIEVTCPLDGTKFMFTPNVSGTPLDRQLDLKPIGFMDVPPRIPVCPSNHFVVYKREFTDEEKDRLRKFVLSQEYQDLAKDNTSYFLLARILTYLGDSDWAVADAYLQASWQVSNKPEKEKEYFDLTLQNIKKFLATNKNEADPKWQTAQKLAGEMERRLGRFDDAKARFVELSKLPGFNQGLNSTIITYELELISKKDSKAHLIPTPAKKSGPS